MDLFKKLFLNEHKQYQKISPQGQKLLLSICLFNIVQPIFAIFINAFLWRRTEDIMIVALFNLAMFCLLPIGFYLNGQLLKHFSVNRLYLAGAVIRAIFIAILLFLPVVNEFSVLLFGMGFGFASGIFFANKNLLTVELTSHANRIYFSSIDFLSVTTSNIIIPAAIGAFLVFGTAYSFYSPQQGYYVIAILVIVISVMLSSVIKKINITTPDIPDIVLHHGTPQWNYARGIAALLGMLSGVLGFLPILIVLAHVGNEGTLGIVQSGAAVISGIIMYFIARILNTRYQIRMIALSIMTLLTGASILAFNFTPAGIFIFIALLTISHQILAVEANSLILDLIDRENTHADHKYKYIFDLEMVLNIGRITSIMCFLFYSKTFSIAFATQYTPLFFAVALTTIIILAKAVETKKSEQAAMHPKLAQSFNSEPAHHHPTNH